MIAVGRLRITQRAIGGVVERVITAATREAAEKNKGQQNSVPVTSRHQRVSRSEHKAPTVGATESEWERSRRCLRIGFTQIDIEAAKAVQQRAPGQAKLTRGQALITFVFAQAIE